MYVRDGPDLPEDLLRGHEEDEVVLFCGAGVSRRVGLPLFGELTRQTADRLGASSVAVASSDFKEERFDVVFSQLEKECGAENVRRVVGELLTSPACADLRTHKAILELGTAKSGRTRVITTNFDDLFVRANPQVPVFCAPALPVPKLEAWDGIVFLHGRFDEGLPRNLVLNSGDFGVAYLLERWASRFVGRLFASASVLLVGYSASDPVMRYLIDAIAAERTAGEAFGRTYALAEAAGGLDEEAAVDEWLAKGIEPILYDPKNDHELLHQTLRNWASFKRGGLGSKVDTVRSVARNMPGIMGPDEVSRLCWSLADDSGAMARELAQIAAGAPIEWLEVLDQQGLLDERCSGGERVSVAGQPEGLGSPLSPVQRGLV